MKTHTAHVEQFEQALAEAIPESRAWARSTDQEGWWVEVVSPMEADRKVVVDLRDGEITILFWVGRSGVGYGPYEANTTIPEDRWAETLFEAAQFVADILNERLILAMRRGWVRGGREFLKPCELTPAQLRQLVWTASWNGTFDRNVPC